MKLLILILSLFFISCSPPKQKSSVFSNHNSTTPILVFGDSLSAHHDLKKEKGWVYLFNQRLHDEKYLNPDQYVANYSISGETTKGGLLRINNAINSTNPKLIILELGANDALRRLSLQDMKQNLQEMIDIAHDKDIDVMIVGANLPPRFFFIPTRQFTQVYKDLHKANDSLFVQNILKDVNSNHGNMLSDGLHPNEKGQIIMLENIWDVFSKNYQ